jgi:5-methylcytosine-specific restriction endonuclease McrA
MVEYNERNKSSKKGKNNPSYKHGLAGTTLYRNQMNSKHRATKKNQTPLNVDLEKTAYIYQVCEATNKVSEKTYEVDHIKPLSKGGLHHQDNLQILEKTLNQQKNAKWPLTEIEELKYKGITLKDLEQGELGG